MTRRVLIVEDSPAMRRLLQLAFARIPEVEVVEASNGAEAFAAVKASPAPFDLVLLDVNMPVMDGLSVLAKLHDDPACARTAFCMVTISEDAETQQRAHELGAHFFLRKPVNRRSVERVVAEVFGVGSPAGA